MNVVHSGAGVNLMVLLVVGITGYLPVVIASGSSTISQLLHLYVGLLLGVLATLWNLANAATLSSLLAAVAVAGTGALFLTQAYRGNRTIRQLLQRVQEQGKVTVNG